MSGSPQHWAPATQGHRDTLPQGPPYHSLAQVPSSDQPLTRPGGRCCNLSSGKGRQRSWFLSRRLVWSFTQSTFKYSLLGTACQYTDNAKTCSALALAQLQLAAMSSRGNALQQRPAPRPPMPNPGATRTHHLSTLAIDRGPTARVSRLQRVNQPQTVLALGGG